MIYHPEPILKPKETPDKLEVDVFCSRKHKKWPYKLCICLIDDGMVFGCNDLREGLNKLRQMYPNAQFSFRLEKQACIKSFNI